MTTQPQTDVGPSAFLCYARFDDDHDDGALSKLRKRLSGEIRAQTGTEFEIFQDRESIQWGENWRQRIEQSLNDVTFLICILTPNFLASDECRKEVRLFLEREEALGRNDLILPIYYIRCPTLEDDAEADADEISTELAKRQRVDWRPLRHEPITSPEVRKKIDELGGKIIDALGRVALQTSSESGQSEAAGAAQVESRPDAGAGAERNTLIVNPTDVDAHATIAEAIEAAENGDRILVHAGVYETPLVFDKALEIIGQGNRDGIIVRVSGANALTAKTSLGRVTNLTLRQAGGGKWFCVDIPEGRLDLEGCDISSESLACVLIGEGADPRLVGNRIHDGKQSGVFVLEGGLGTLEDNDIFGNGLAGIEIKGGNPRIRGNRIFDGQEGAILVQDDGLGTIEHNDIFGNRFAGIEIKEGADPAVRRNRIHDGKESGIIIHTNGLGILEDNDISNNAFAGISVKGGTPIVRNNRINRNGYQAIRISEAAGGTFTDNDLGGNKKGAWAISDDSLKNVERSGNIEDNPPDA